MVQSSPWKSFKPSSVQVKAKLALCPQAFHFEGDNNLSLGFAVMLKKIEMVIAVTHVWGKLCGFIHYNLQYVMFMVVYIALKLPFDIIIKINYLYIYDKLKKLLHYIEESDV
jgi:hypothetical protein